MYRDKLAMQSKYHFLTALLLLCILGACTPTLATQQTPDIVNTLTPTVKPTRTPLPTWTPTPVPTPTPIPPAEVKINWPHTASAIEPIPIEVEFNAPSGIAAEARIEVTVMDPAAETYAVFSLPNRDGSRYYSNELLQLPLHPLGGYWFIIADIDTPLKVEGSPVHFFVPEPIHFRPLETVLPQNVKLRIPIAFEEISSQGDLYAGSRIWQYRDGQIGLWWAPGPTEELLLNNAITMLEATFPEQTPPAIIDVTEAEWFGRTTFVASLLWSDARPGVAWIVQDNDYWLYVLEIHALQGTIISPFFEEVAATFGFVER
jgi:hypothetical protein